MPRRTARRSARRSARSARRSSKRSLKRSTRRNTRRVRRNTRRVRRNTRRMKGGAGAKNLSGYKGSFGKSGDTYRSSSAFRRRDTRNHPYGSEKYKEQKDEKEEEEEILRIIRNPNIVVCMGKQEAYMTPIGDMLKHFISSGSPTFVSSASGKVDKYDNALKVYEALDSEEERVTGFKVESLNDPDILRITASCLRSKNLPKPYESLVELNNDLQKYNFGEGTNESIEYDGAITALGELIGANQRSIYTSEEPLKTMRKFNLDLLKQSKINALGVFGIEGANPFFIEDYLVRLGGDGRTPDELSDEESMAKSGRYSRPAYHAKMTTRSGPNFTDENVLFFLTKQLNQLNKEILQGISEQNGIEGEIQPVTKDGNFMKSMLADMQVPSALKAIFETGGLSIGREGIIQAIKRSNIMQYAIMHEINTNAMSNEESPGGKSSSELFFDAIKHFYGKKVIQSALIQTDCYMELTEMDDLLSIVSLGLMCHTLFLSFDAEIQMTRFIQACVTLQQYFKITISKITEGSDKLHILKVNIVI